MYQDDAKIQAHNVKIADLHLKWQRAHESDLPWDVSLIHDILCGSLKVENLIYGR